MLRDFDLLDLLTQGSTVTVPNCQRLFSFRVCSQASRRAIVIYQGGPEVHLVLHLVEAAVVRGWEAYRVPYLPVIPTFFVRFVILAVLCG